MHPGFKFLCSIPDTKRNACREWRKTLNTERFQKIPYFIVIFYDFIYFIILYILFQILCSIPDTMRNACREWRKTLNTERFQKISKCYNLYIFYVTVLIFIYFITNFIIFQTRLAGKKKCPVVNIPVGERGRLHMQRFG